MIRGDASARPGRPDGEALCFLGARELARRIRDREVSAREVMEAHLARISRWNPVLNAIVARLPDADCLALADAADRTLARGRPPGPLFGLPVAFKDLQPAVGFPFTRGSRAFEHDRPAVDSVLVERLRAAGAIPIGKTNVPEFGMGSHTYNTVYGATRNPWDPTRSAGGSSGGAGAALAAGLLPVADGSDLGGSLRCPANFNNVVALRPSPGLVPHHPNPLPGFALSVNGPMARSVADVAWLLSVMAGPDPRDPFTVPRDPRAFAAPLDRDFAGVRVAWCPDLGGLPLDPAVRAVLENARGALESLGCRVEEACPDLAGADESFLTLRAWRSHALLGPVLEAHREVLKPEAVQEIEAGGRLSGADVARAVMLQGELLGRFLAFEERHPFLACAVNQLPPFDVTVDWPRAVDGAPMEHYVAWMRSAYWITMTLRPALSVPAGFTPDGLPVGLQIVGSLGDDLGTLRLGHAFARASGAGERRPPTPTLDVPREPA